MKAMRTHLSNDVFCLAGGTEDNDLWVTRARTQSGERVICSTWVLTDEERDYIAKGGNIELVVWSDGHPPVAMRVTDNAIGEMPTGPECDFCRRDHPCGCDGGTCVCTCGRCQAGRCPCDGCTNPPELAELPDPL